MKMVKPRKDKEKKNRLDNIEEQEEPIFEVAESPEPTLRDVMLQLNRYQNDIIETVEAVKALGARIIEDKQEQDRAMFALSEQMGQVNAAVVAMVSNVADVRNEIRGTNPPTRKLETPKSTAQEAKTKIQLPPAATFPISEAAKQDLVFGFREGIGNTVKFKIRVSSDDWNKANTFLRALNMIWVSDKVAKIFEWQPK